MNLLRVRIGIFLLGLSSCGDTQKEARSELTAKSFTFTVDEYIRAAREGNVAALRYFLEAGMAVDVTDAEGATALFRAAENGRSAARDGDFSIVDAFVDVGDGCDGEGVILTPQPSPTVALGVGRMLQKFGVV